MESDINLGHVAMPLDDNELVHDMVKCNDMNKKCEIIIVTSYSYKVVY